MQLVSATSTTYVCNGRKGDAGADGLSVHASQIDEDRNCPTGGVKLEVGTSTTYVCNGARGPAGPQGPAGDSAGAASDRYAGSYSLAIDGVDVGPVDLIDGCAESGIVIRDSNNLAHLSLPTVDPCVFDFGENVAPALWQWFAADLVSGATIARHSFTLTRLDDGSAIDCTNGLATGLSLPRVAPGTSASFLLEGTLSPEACTRANGTAPPARPAIVPFSQNETHATLEGVGSNDAQSVDPFAVILQTTHVDPLGHPVAQFFASKLQPPDLRLHFPAADDAAIGDLRSWYESFVIDGANTADHERGAVVSLHDGGVTLSFGHAGIFRLDPEERTGDGTYRADLYTENMTFSGADTGL